MLDVLLVFFGLFLGIALERDFLGPRRVRLAKAKHNDSDAKGERPQPRPTTHVESDKAVRSA